MRNIATKNALRLHHTFYIVGPTAVGKSSLAADVAARLNAEIIGADALQVYAGFTLLTAKPSAPNLARAPHHLIGVVPPTDDYSVARYLEAATECQRNIRERGRLALVVGGSGLYVKALTHGLSPLPEAQPDLRARLEALDLAALNARLAELDPAAAAFIDRKNKRRLVRAIEVCLVTGGRFSDARSQWTQPSAPRGVLLFREKEDLHRRIDARVEEMFAAGVVDEVRFAADIPLSATARQMIGLDAIRQLLAGRLSEPECRERIKLETRQYAKRQLTWFKREKSFTPINLSTAADPIEQILVEIDRCSGGLRPSH